MLASAYLHKYLHTQPPNKPAKVNKKDFHIGQKFLMNLFSLGGIKTTNNANPPPTYRAALIYDINKM